jgi:hypothetical protein
VFPFDATLDGWIALAWLGAVTVVALLVTWVVTDLGHVKRTPFVGVLAIVTAAATAGYLAWSGAGSKFWTYHWAWGLLGAAVTSAAMLVFARRLPRRSRQRDISALVVWEGLVYGISEGLLLSVLPVAITWQLGRSFGWAAGVGAVVALVVSAAVIAIHHLGYREFRNRMMRYPVILCGVLSIAYLLTANPIAPLVGHVVFHVAMLNQGMELPPHAKSEEDLKAQLVAAA